MAAEGAGGSDAALLCAQAPHIPGWIIGFHLQHAVEKALKADLVLLGIEPPRTHDLRVLVETVELAGGRSGIDLDLAAALTPFAVRDRYPFLAVAEVERERVVGLARRVGEVLGFLSRGIGLDSP